MNATRLPITLFTELAMPELSALLAREDVRALWRTGRFSLAMAMLDLSEARAIAVRELEALGVEVTAWLLLDEADGYWLNADNAEKAEARFASLAAYAREHGLRFARVGLDIEPPRADFESIFAEGIPAVLRLFERRRSKADIAHAEAAYERLCTRIRQSGRSVESYCIPLVFDDTRAGSTLLRRTLGIVSPTTDAQVPMAYSSHLGRPLALSFLRDFRAVALGVTGGGVFEQHDRARQLDFAALAEELDWAVSHGAERLYVFSLEGCASGAMLSSLAAWQPRERPRSARLFAQATLGDVLRRALRALLSSESLLDRL